MLPSVNKNMTGSFLFFFARGVTVRLFVSDAINRTKSNYQFVSIRRAATSALQSTENIYLADFH